MTEQVPSKEKFRTYKRVGAIEARPYERGDQATLNISISEADLTLPTLVGGMVARNPDNHKDMWYIAATYFAKHYSADEPRTLLDMIENDRARRQAAEDACEEFVRMQHDIASLLGVDADTDSIGLHGLIYDELTRRAAQPPGACRHGTREPHECRQCIDEDVIRVRAFWSRDRKQLINAFVSDKDITLMDDNGHTLESAGDERWHGPSPTKGGEHG